MKPLLTCSGLRRLARHARPRLLLALDYDGTLAPIRDEPSHARMSPRTRALLRRVARRYPTIILTGRARADALRLLGPLRHLQVVGNHGAEWPTGTAPANALVAGWRRHLQRALAGIEGLWVEDKRHSLSVHYRQSPEPAAARAAALAGARTLPQARIIGAMAVINLLPVQSPHKGQALLAARQQLRCPHALFVGDDVTDEDVFRLRRPRTLMGVRVGHEPRSAAQYWLRGRTQVDVLLGRLLALR